MLRMLQAKRPMLEDVDKGVTAVLMQKVAEEMADLIEDDEPPLAPDAPLGDVVAADEPRAISAPSSDCADAARHSGP